MRKFTVLRIHSGTESSAYGVHGFKVGDVIELVDHQAAKASMNPDFQEVHPKPKAKRKAKPKSAA